MASRYTDAFLNHAAQLYAAGQPLVSISRELGGNPDVLSEHLKRIGVNVTRVGRGYGIRHVMPEDFPQRYQSGESAYALAKSYGVSRTTINSWLDRACIKRRGCSAAGKVRASKMTPEERAAQSVAAHDAVRGAHRTLDSNIKGASTRERKAHDGLVKMSSGESLMDRWLTSRGMAHAFQKAIGPYNVDFAIGDSVAVEILGGSWHATKSKRIKESKRAEYILNFGWSIVFVWNTYAVPMTEICAEQIVSIVDVVRSDPSSRGKYWVVRGDGKLVTARCGDMNEGALVVPSRCA